MEPAMANDHLLLRDHSGKPWAPGSLAREYLEKLPIANAEENFRESDTRYLLPRNNIFTFGLQNGITERVIYCTCNICHAIVKPHDVKSHMLTKHTKQDLAGCSTQVTPAPPTTIVSKSKKSSHKSKKKVVPPPSVPPPPLFPKVEFTPPATVTAASASEDLLPPVLQPAETVETKSSSHKSSEKSEDVTKASTVSTTIALSTATTTVTASNAAATATVTILNTPTTSSVTVTSVTNSAASISSLPPTLPVEVSTKKTSSTSTTTSSKTREKSSKSERDSYKRKRSKRNKVSGNFDPDKHCGVLDSLKRPCMRTLTCANHTIIERRAVPGRSKNLDKLITEYKASRVKNKLQSVLPITIAPKQSSSLKEVRNGLRVIELIYGNDSQNNLGNSELKCQDDPIMTSVLENLASITHRVPKAIKPTTFYVPPSPELEQVARVTKLPPGTFLKVSLSQSSPPLPGGKATEVPSQTPALYSAHPKPMTMLTNPLRRVGSSFVLQHAPRLERQRLDLQAVVNQHKQLKVATPNKPVSLLNSNHNKQSLLKSNVKNNIKTNPLKRPSIEKANVNDIKHMKVMSADMNGFILNTDFADNDAQTANTVQDKIALLK